MVGIENVHLDHMRLLDQGTVEKLAPQSPVEIGEELEVKLGEVGLHDARAGVGKVKGFEVVVADAAKLVGKKVRVRVVAVMEGLAYAVEAGTAEDSQPITAEAEAERPTRTRRSSKTADTTGETAEAEGVEAPQKRSPRRAPARKPAAAAAEPEAGADTEPDEQPVPKRSRARRPVPAEAATEVVVETADAPADDVEGETATAASKRTRRGTRGGRGRKRRPTPAEANGDSGLTEEPEGVAEAPQPVPEEASTPVIHLPDRDLGANGEEAGEGETAPAPRKRTRRGTRGGRGRKRKPAAVAAGEESAGGDESRSPQSEREAEWEYTPMSEWGDV
jgi:predicted RNA-binding protein with TRAM domain